VVLLQGVPESALQIFTAEASYDVEVCPEALSEAQLAKKIEDAHIIGIGPQTEEVLTEELIRSAHRLLAIGCFSVDTVSVNVQTATDMGIPVFYSPYGISHSQAEFAIGEIILLARQLGDRNNEMHSGNWQKKSANCCEIRGKTLGIIGYGHVGSQLGIIAEFFGMKVVWYDNQPLMPIGNSTPLDSMNDVLRVADFLSIHISESPDNENLVGKAQLSQMKKGSFLINCSFGKAVDLAALAEMMKSGHILGAAIDAFPEGDKPTTSVDLLKSLPNVILTPKIGGHTLEASVRVGVEVGQQLDRYINEGCTRGSINFPIIETRPLAPNKIRILNIHKNVRGVVKEINNLLSSSNISKQILETKDSLGYAIIELEKKENTTEILSALALLANSIRTRCL